MSAANASTSASSTSRQRAENLKFDKYGKSPTRKAMAAGTAAGSSGAAAMSSDAGTPGGSPQAGGATKEKRMTMRAVRSIMRLGRGRQASQARDSSTEDEGR